MKKFIITSLLLSLLSIGCTHDPIEISPPDTRLNWFNDAKFGMFIHWGVYSGMAGKYVGPSLYGIEYTEASPFLCSWSAEWILSQAGIPRDTYKKQAKNFTATQFDGNEIASLAKETGMKYIIITVKHHEGFLLYPSTIQPDWCTSTSGANGRDLIMELLTAAKSKGLKVGLYFSQNLDWMTEGSLGEIPQLYGGKYDIEKNRTYIDYTCKVISEIMDRYGEILDVFWWDIPQINTSQEFTNQLQNALIKHKNYNKRILQNDRLSTLANGDFATPEGVIIQKPERPYELCITMDGSWGYTDYANNKKTRLELLYEITNTVSKGGNLLLNISPKGDGSLHPDALKLLKEIGDYMQINSESIYGTEHSGFTHGQDFGRVTRKGNSLYLHYYVGDKVELYGINSPILSAKTISGRNIEYKKIPNGYKFIGLKKGEVAKVTFSSIIIDEGFPISNKMEETNLYAMSALAEGGLSINGFESGFVNYNSWINLWPDLGWLLKVENPAKYDIYTTISNGGPGKLEIKIESDDNARIYYQYPTTRGYDDYQEMKVGSMYIKSGKQEIVFKRVGGSPLNFASMRLVRVDN
ncbi:alpha-L-fucosidase [Bacteroides nordii]|uniref:alpha-L-fucosidase n=2 Tax=Bacteroides nordii TaxID=291645 RepID=UPI002A83B2EA|nr:alpha-L-fucosidase [Bacteroides nordii]